MSAAASVMHSTKITILLSVNAAAILVVGILIASALGFNLGDFHVVSARNDDAGAELTEDALVTTGASADNNLHGSTGSGGMNVDGETSSGTRGWVSADPVKSGELWNEEEITIYRSADIDICVGGELTNLGPMYWQTSNSSVISGFYSGARTWLGYHSATCRYPVITGTGKTTITAGTYDGLRKDSITVNVIDVPVDDWKREILTLVNKFRAEKGLSTLEWGTTCEKGAQTRASELIQNYSHTRPNGTEWKTACQIPAGETAGENLMAGNAATSPELTMAAWINSPDHYKNLVDPRYTKLAVGLVFDPSAKYQIYWSQFFSTY